MSRSASRRALGLAAVALLAASPAAARPDVAARNAALPAPPSGAALAALAQPPARTAIASERIYFVLTDRYANGDPANDRGGRSGPRGLTGFDPADTGWFHGGDFTAVDPHLGSEADFAAFVACAHRLGLKVYLDVVVNHTADVIVPTGSGYSAAPYRDCRGRVFDPARYATAKRFPCLKASGFPRVPVLLAEDRAAKKPAWLNDVRRYHNRGDIAFDSCSEKCFEQGDFFGLDDLFTEQPAVRNGLAQVYAGWIRRYKIDGFRVDTARHVDRAFFRLWVPKLRAAARAAGVREFELFGEVFVSDAIELSGFVRERKLPNVLDFPLQDAATRYAAGDASAKGIAARLDDDDYFRGPDGVAPTPPTFLGNHDMGRAARMIKDRSGGASGRQLLRRVLLGHSLLYLLRGAPVVYYGDEVGIIGAGGDKEARQDLFPTQVAGWRSEERVGSPPIGTGSSLEQSSHPVAEHLRALAALRQAHPALSTGATVVRLASGGVLAVSRIDAAARREYVAAFNAGVATARVVVPTGTPGATWTGLLGTGAASDGAGRLTLSLPPQSAVLLRADADLPVARTPAPVLRAAPDDLTDLVRLTATPGGAKTVSVAFAVKRRTGGWKRLAVDDSPPFRAFLDPAGYRRGEVVHVVAVARGLEGSTAVGKVRAVTPRR